jgi:hypothetical protein
VRPTKAKSCDTTTNTFDLAAGAERLNGKIKIKLAGTSA